MAIVSSLIASDARQRDGRRWIAEVHTDHLGAAHAVRYLAAPADDAGAGLAQRAAQIGATLRDQEIAANVSAILSDGAQAPLAVVHSTTADNRAALRLAYQTASRVEAIMLGDFLNTLTDAQLRSLFGATQAQVTALRTNKLIPAANAAATIRASSGA